jgi:hypothetical protein
MTQVIIYNQDNGVVAVIIPTPEALEQHGIQAIAIKDVPAGKPYEIVEDDAIPSDRTFRNAWVMGDCCIDHDLDKCRAIGHDIRRTKRAEEFAPHDEVIAKQIPGKDATQAEAKRQEIRDKYSEVQDAIDAAESPEEIKAALEAS